MEINCSYVCFLDKSFEQHIFCLFIIIIHVFSFLNKFHLCWIRAFHSNTSPQHLLPLISIQAHGSALYIHCIFFPRFLHQIYKIHNSLSCIYCINNEYSHIWTKKWIFKGSIYVQSAALRPPVRHFVVDSGLNNTAPPFLNENHVDSTSSETPGIQIEAVNIF